MKTATSLLKIRKMAKWCKLAALIIAAISISYIIFATYTLSQQYLLFSAATRTFQIFSYLSYTVVPLFLASTFYSLILYTIGVVAEHMSTEVHTPDEDSERVEITSLPSSREASRASREAEYFNKA